MSSKPPDTLPEGRGVVIEPPEEVGGAEDYYRRIHAHRTVLAMRAAKLPEAMAVMVDEETEEARREGAAALLRRVFAAEKEANDLRERLDERTRERDAARGEVVMLKERLSKAREALE